MYSRIDDRYITDDIVRTLLHQAVLLRVSAYHADNFQYTIRLDELYRSDLAAFRAYGNVDLRWVFRILAGHETETEEMPTGTTFILPDMAWIREQIRRLSGSSPEVANG